MRLQRQRQRRRRRRRRAARTPPQRTGVYALHLAAAATFALAAAVDDRIVAADGAVFRRKMHTVKPAGCGGKSVIAGGGWWDRRAGSPEAAGEVDREAELVAGGDEPGYGTCQSFPWRNDEKCPTPAAAQPASRQPGDSRRTRRLADLVHLLPRSSSTL